MTQLYLRQIGLDVTPKNASSKLDLSALRIKFAVAQSTIESPNTADIRVYNLSDDTVARLKQGGEGAQVQLTAGYPGLTGLIFKGTTIQMKSGRENPTDTFLDLICTDGDKAYNHAVVSQSVAAGTPAKNQLETTVKAMNPYGVTLGYVPTLTQQPSPRGKTLFGLARDFIRDLAHSNDSSWSIQNGQVTIIPNQAYLPGQAVVINSETGMIGLPTQTILGISVRTLLNPALKIGTRIQLNNGSIQKQRLDSSYTGQVNNAFLPRVVEGDGFYRALVIEHSGDTRGNEWYSDLVCIAVGDPITKGLVSRGINDAP